MRIVACSGRQTEVQLSFRHGCEHSVGLYNNLMPIIIIRIHCISLYPNVCRAGPQQGQGQSEPRGHLFLFVEIVIFIIFHLMYSSFFVLFALSLITYSSLLIKLLNLKSQFPRLLELNVFEFAFFFNYCFLTLQCHSPRLLLLLPASLLPSSLRARPWLLPMTTFLQRAIPRHQSHHKI